MRVGREFTTARPVAIVSDQDTHSTLSDSILPLGQGFFHIETHDVTTPTDTDRDGIDDFTTLQNPGTNNALNPAPPITLQLKDQMNILHSHFRSKYGAFGNDWAMEIEFKITEEAKLAIKQARPWLD